MIKYYEADVVQANDYYPFGLMMSGRSWSEGYRFGFNGQEQNDEVYGDGILNTALHWEYDTRLGRRWNIDPKPVTSVSCYATFLNNPILYTDYYGDTIIVDKRGYITRNDQTDNLVFTQQNGKLTSLGEVGGTIDINTIYSNLLQTNIQKAKSLNKIQFFWKVKNNGSWDLKNNESTIYGYAYESSKKGKIGKTKFEYNGEMLRSTDLGNHHYGAVGLATGDFAEEELLREAGQAQIRIKKTKLEWQPIEATYDDWTPYGLQEREVLGPPYGDDPKDQHWIKEGFKDFKEIEKKERL